MTSKSKNTFTVKREDCGNNWVNCGTYQDEKAAYAAANREKARSGKRVKVEKNGCVDYFA